MSGGRSSETETMPTRMLNEKKTEGSQILEELRLWKTDNFFPLSLSFSFSLVGEPNFALILSMKETRRLASFPPFPLSFLL